MKRLFVLTITMAAFGFASAQWFSPEGSGGASGGASGSGSASGGASGGGTVRASGTTGSGSSSGAAAPAATPSPELATPVIGTHYDDPAESHYEPPHTNNDGRPNMDEAVAVPYPYLREADVKYKKRIWRRIDTRQKLNKSFTWPGQPITQVLYELATKGKVKAYNSDSLATWMTPEDAFKKGSELIVTQVPNWRNPDDPTDLVDTQYYEAFKWEKIIKFEVMEDWIFDYKYSEFRPRIIAIAPLMTKTINGMSIEVPLFWLRMTDLRPTLAKSEVFNRYNDAMRISWDDLFNHYRLFDSYIVKQSYYNNLYLNQMPEYMQDGLAALLEGENIKNDLFIFEHDLWEY